jgi:hypothetical protein
VCDVKQTSMTSLLVWKTHPVRLISAFLIFAACSERGTLQEPTHIQYYGQDSSTGVGADYGISLPDVNSTDAGGCTHTSCLTQGGQYCGDIGDQCGGMVSCGDCPAGKVCQNHLCIDETGCTKVACEFASGSYCGKIGDGCGGALECATTCSKAGWQCVDNQCVGPPEVCTKQSCTSASGDRYCGKIGDGCGGTLNCGATCLDGRECVDNVCVLPASICKKATCDTAGGDRYCGKIGDGCGGTLDCGSTCPKAGWQCVDNICTGIAGACTPATCDTVGDNRYCGKVGNGCGGELDCGATCPKLGWECVDNTCVGAASVCTKLTCDTASGDRYCGKVGDGCGGTLDCGATCPKSGWQCINHLCTGSPGTCTKATCETASGDRYCGTISDGCGGTLDCGTTCPKSGWVCGPDQICKGPPEVCTKNSCDTASGDRYCGTMGDGCGGKLECGTTCPKSGWVCGTNQICQGPPGVCTQLSCGLPNGQRYCGTIGDGCGGSLECGTTCPTAGWECRNNLCVGSSTACTPLSCTTANGDQYCGSIGDGCGGTLNCGTCSKPGWVCDANLCKGPAGVCTKHTCDTASGDEYCGVIGDGCGGTLDCGATCGKSGWLCENHLCKGPATVCTKKSCTTANGDQYCGMIGDGCGGTLDCGTSCLKSGWVCENNACKGPASVCIKNTCTTANGDQYCGVIGDGCGGTLECSTTCSKPGWVCDNSLCKGPTNVCTKNVCSPSSGGQYCGTIGDGCGGSLDCGTTCTTPGWQCANHLCVGGSSCVKASCNNEAGVQQYCGTIGDNCGGSVNCPFTCPGGVACGSTIPNVCGNGNACTGLCLQRVTCDGGVKTSLSGTVYDPAGKVPLYNVIVYIPNADLKDITTGATCDQCGASVSGNPLASALTDKDGKFTLEDVPVGTDIPLVMQVGKWRRKITLPTVTACMSNVIQDPGPVHNVLRLPRNKSEGNIPRIMMTTGGADTMECFLRRIGISDSEFTLETSREGDGRVHMFRGRGGTSAFTSALGGATFTAAKATPATSFWDSINLLKQYDIIVHSCEGAEDAKNKTPAALLAMAEYVNAGGRVFASHYHHYWFEKGPDPLPSVATWCKNGCNDPPSPSTALLDTSFPKGNALADWLINVGGSTTRGELVEYGPQRSVISATPGTSTRWVYLTTPATVQYLTFNTPIGVPEASQCGRAVVSDIHVADVPSGVSKDTYNAFPSGCRNRDLTAQEKALEFLFFDLSACIQSDTVTPISPPPAPITLAPPAPPPPASAPPPAAVPPASAPPPPAAPPAPSAPPPAAPAPPAIMPAAPPPPPAAAAPPPPVPAAPVSPPAAAAPPAPPAVSPPPASPPPVLPPTIY